MNRIRDCNYQLLENYDNISIQKKKTCKMNSVDIHLPNITSEIQNIDRKKLMFGA